MKITKVINKENKSDNTVVRNNKRAISEEELRECARLTKLVENEETAELVSDEEYEAYEAADIREMTDEEIERFQKRYLDFISHEDLGYRKDVAVMDYVRCVAARAIDQCQHPELYSAIFEEADAYEGDEAKEVLKFYMCAEHELDTILYIIDLCGLIDDVDLEEYKVIRNTVREARS